MAISWVNYLLEGRVTNITDTHSILPSIQYFFGPPAAPNWSAVARPKTFGLTVTARY
jgi:hypothetical protein